jgi:hypothetical protein
VVVAAEVIVAVEVTDELLEVRVRVAEADATEEVVERSSVAAVCG